MRPAPPTLEDVLALDDALATHEIVTRPRRYVGQAPNIGEAGKSRLIALLEELWPRQSFRSAIRVEGDRWTYPGAVHAILVLGPPVDLPLTPARWAAVACSGLVFDEQAAWLRSQYSAAGVLAVATECDASDVRTWEQVLSAIPDDAPIP